MTRLTRLLIGLLLANCHAAVAEQVLLTPNPLDLDHLSIPDPTLTRMRSGFDFNDGNYDSGNLVRIEPAGSTFSATNTTWVLFDEPGPGVITSTWLTGKSKQGRAWIGGRLNFHFDREPVPSLSGELPALLESSGVFPHGLAERSHGAWICYAPIYFSNSLRITITDHQDRYGHRVNGRGQGIPHLYHQFTWQKLSRPVPSWRHGDPRIQAWSQDRPGERASTTVALTHSNWQTLFTASGEGILNGLSLSWEAADPDGANLRVQADGKVTLQMPAHEFWGFNRAARPEAKFRSLLLGVDDNGAYYCRFPMPHRRALRLEILPAKPGGRVRVASVHQQGWRSPDHLYFHAKPVSDLTERGRDIKLLKCQGRGHYVGTILELADKTLEGDDRFYVDGEPFPPAWHGTGTEDYFRCGWYFLGGPTSRPLYGLLDGKKPKIAYRFHLADRVNFSKSVVIGFEHGHRNEYLGPYRGVVFWYAEK